MDKQSGQGLNFPYSAKVTDFTHLGLQEISNPAMNDSPNTVGIISS
jgi:hypothetical protein